jgi:hypothetical protein
MAHGLAEDYVVAGVQPGEMAAGESAERVAERLPRRFQPPWDVLRLGEVGEGHPAGEDDIDEHEDPLGRQVGEDVAGGVAGPWCRDTAAAAALEARDDLGGESARCQPGHHRDAVCIAVYGATGPEDDRRALG